MEYLRHVPKKRSTIIATNRLLKKKATENLKDIHQALVNQRIKTDYDVTYDPRYDSNNNLSRKEQQQDYRFSAKPRFRSRSQLSDHREPATKDIASRKPTSPDGPINIFISVEKLSKIKIDHSNDNNGKKRVPSKRSVFSSLDKKKSVRDLYEDKYHRKQSYVEKPSHPSRVLDTAQIRQTLNQLKSTTVNRRRLKTLDDSPSPQIKHKELHRNLNKSTNHNNYSSQKRSSLPKPPPAQEEDLTTAKLKYEDLKNDYDRFPAGFKKFKLLGRGGFSLVWMGYHKKTKKAYAVKQILTKNKYQTHLKEIWFCNFFFEQGGEPHPQFADHPGIDNILCMYDYQIEELDTWIIYEMCDGSLGSMLYDLYKEEDESGEQQFLIKYKQLYIEMRKDTYFLKHVIYEIALTLDLLCRNNIVHSDLKTENILTQIREGPNRYRYKLIDYGSSFVFSSLKQYTLATPEYMCPELLNFILYQNGHDHNKQMLELVKDYSNISAIDVWGLGCVVLEIINGLPLWLTNPTRLLHKEELGLRKGLFAVDNRSFRKIIDKQLQVINSLDAFFKQQNHSGILLDAQIKSILKRMLHLDPLQRMRPAEIIKQLGITLAPPIESTEY